jgi:hypothetical protein
MYKKYFKEKFDKEEINQLKKQFQIILKNIKNVNSIKDFKILIDIYDNFYDYLQEVLYDKLRIKDRLGSWSNEFENPKGSLYNLLNSFFPTNIFPSQYPKKNNYDIDTLKSLYNYWDLERNKKYKIIQKNSKTLIDELNYFLEKESLSDNKILKSEIINGVKVLTIIYEPRENHEIKNFKSEMNKLNYCKSQLKKAIDLINKRKLKKVLSGLEVLIDSRPISKIRTEFGLSFETEGIYFAEDNYLLKQYGVKPDSLIIFTSVANSYDFLWTIIHEIGHRFDYKIIGKEGQKEWENFVDNLPSNIKLTKYAEESPEEFWAETFTLYVLGRQIPNIIEGKFKYLVGLK